MSIVASDIRKFYRQFKDIGIFTDYVIGVFLAKASTSLDPIVWGGLLDYATQLYVAHHLTLWARNDQAAAMGGSPGEIKGPLTSRTVDKVSSSWDSRAASYEGEAFWNLTAYGVEFWSMAKNRGGGVQL